MSLAILRRRKLGRTSCREISNKMRNPIKVVRNWKDKFPINTDLVIRWGCTSDVPVRNVLNTARAIHQVGDKLGFRRTLNREGLSPKTIFHYDARANLGMNFPLVLRPAHHAQGRRLHVINNYPQLLLLCNRYGEGNYYISELINKVAEYRVFVVQGRAVCVAQKTPGNPDEVAWNVAKGGRFDNVRWDQWPLKAVRVSIEAFNLSELDFGGVDVMVDADGNCYVLEINSAPSLTSDYRQSCMAKAFDYIVANGKERIPLVERKGGYKKFIHPAICDQALIKEGDN